VDHTYGSVGFDSWEYGRLLGWDLCGLCDLGFKVWEAGERSKALHTSKVWGIKQERTSHYRELSVRGHSHRGTRQEQTLAHR
jgi:hypothetical protein